MNCEEVHGQTLETYKRRTTRMKESRHLLWGSEKLRGLWRIASRAEMYIVLYNICGTRALALGSCARHASRLQLNPFSSSIVQYTICLLINVLKRTANLMGKRGGLHGYLRAWAPRNPRVGSVERRRAVTARSSRRVLGYPVTVAATHLPHAFRHFFCTFFLLHLPFRCFFAHFGCLSLHLSTTIGSDMT